MKHIALLLVLIGLSTSFVRGQPEKPAAAVVPATRFTYVDLMVDSKDKVLAAYQIEFAAEGGHALVVGIEGGEHAAFANPPYYDSAAMQHERVIVAAFNIGKDLPKGKTRVVRIHLMIEGKTPEFAVKLVAAADADGKGISGAKVSWVEGVRQ